MDPGLDMTTQTQLKRFCCAMHWALCALMFMPVAFAGSMEDGPPDDLSEGPSYYGYVREDRGVSVMKAKVTLKPKVGATVEVQANVMGAYRSHVNAQTKPEDVEVTCAKPGYTFVRMVRRPTSTSRVVEIDCLMKRSG
jgi:hypothetical protein